MPRDEFENWVDIDKDVEVVATMTLSEICKEVTDDDSKLSKESECNIYTEEEISEPPPTNAQIQDALLQQMLRYKMPSFNKCLDTRCLPQLMPRYKMPASS